MARILGRTALGPADYTASWITPISCGGRWVQSDIPNWSIKKCSTRRIVLHRRRVRWDFDYFTSILKQSFARPPVLCAAGGAPEVLRVPERDRPGRVKAGRFSGRIFQSESHHPRAGPASSPRASRTNHRMDHLQVL